MVPFERGSTHAGFTIPNTDGVSDSGRCQTFIVRRKRQCRHEGLLRTKTDNFSASGQVPNLNIAFPVARCQEIAAMREGKRKVALRTDMEFLHLRARFNIPHFNSVGSGSRE